MLGYTHELSGGRQFQEVGKGVCMTKLDDDTTINVRSVSSSNVSRWMIDMKGNFELQAIKATFKENHYEIKFK